MKALLVVLLLSAAGWAQSAPKHDASWWNQQPASYKLGYLTGYEAAHPIIQEACIAEKVSSEICSRIAPLFVLGGDEKDALGRLELFYKDRRNQDVILELALIVVGQDIATKAMNEYDRAQSLERMRQISEPKPK